MMYQICTFISALLILTDVIGADDIPRDDWLDESPLNDVGRKGYNRVPPNDGALTVPGPQVDATVDLGNGRSYDRYIGIWTDDDQDVFYRINDQYTVFTGVLGLGRYASEDCDSNYDIEEDTNFGGKNKFGDSLVKFYNNDNGDVIYKRALNDFADVFEFAVDVSGINTLRIEVNDLDRVTCILATIADPRLTNGNCERDGLLVGHNCACVPKEVCDPNDPFGHEIRYVSQANGRPVVDDSLFCEDETRVCCCACEDSPGFPGFPGPFISSVRIDT